METRLSERVLLLSHAGMRRRRRVQRQTQQPTTTAPYERVPCANGKAFRASLDNMRRNAKCQHVPHGRAQPSSNMHACNSAAPHAHPASTRVHSRIVEKHTHTHTHRPHILMPPSRGMCFFHGVRENRRGRPVLSRSETAAGVSSIRVASAGIYQITRGALS